MTTIQKTFCKYDPEELKSDLDELAKTPNQRLHSRRLSLDLTIKEVAKRVGISARRLRRIETEGTIPSELITPFCLALGVDANYIFLGFNRDAIKEGHSPVGMPVRLWEIYTHLPIHYKRILGELMFYFNDIDELA